MFPASQSRAAAVEAGMDRYAALASAGDSVTVQQFAA
jgi:hypothetical protein